MEVNLNLIGILAGTSVESHSCDDDCMCDIEDCNCDYENSCYSCNS